MRRPPFIRVGSRRISSGEPPFVIAEAGVNHNGDIRVARRLVEAAASAGADAVKFQSFRAENLVLPGTAKLGYQKRNTGGGTQWDMLKELELSKAHHRELADLCRKKKIMFLSSPFDEESARFLLKLNVAAFKIASGELTNHPFLKWLSRWKTPLLLSTGMATMDEVRAAVRAVRRAGNPPLALLHCVSLYPAWPEETNLRAIPGMAEAFRVPVGFSDHSEGTALAPAAVALGACIVEKHFTLGRSLPGPDHRASLMPGELRKMIVDIRTVAKALGDGDKSPVPRERETALAARRSLVALREVPRGETIKPAMVGALRPGGGIPPSRLASVVGKKARRRIPAFTPLSMEMLA